MPKPVIVPVAKSLYLCDGTIGLPGGKTDVMGIFNSMNAVTYPHHAIDFVVFGQLSQGLGRIPFYIEVRLASTSQLIYASNVHLVHFPNRGVTVQLAYTVAGCRLPQSGLYLVELFCNNQWVGDTTLNLR